MPKTFLGPTCVDLGAYRGALPLRALQNCQLYEIGQAEFSALPGQTAFSPIQRGNSRNRLRLFLFMLSTFHNPQSNPFIGIPNSFAFVDMLACVQHRR